MRDEGKISVVIPALNAVKTIGEALESVLQNEHVSQVIVINNASTDATQDMVESFEDPRVELLFNERPGISYSLNIGFEAATSKYVARCDADDLFTPDRARWQYNWLENNPDYVAVSAAFAAITKSGKHISNLACEGDARDVTESLLHGKAITHFCTWLVRKDSIQKIGGARPWFKTAEDVDMQFRLAETGRVWHEPKLAYKYRLHDDSITHKDPSFRLDFFDQMAHKFALQRRAHGKDDLQCGKVISIDDHSCENKSTPRNNSVRDQTIGYLQADAWRNFDKGKYLVANRCLINAIKQNPYSYHLWLNFLSLISKSIYSWLLNNKSS